jgi:hypothetical protein
VSREVLKFQGVFQKKAPTDHDFDDGNDSDKCGTRRGVGGRDWGAGVQPRQRKPVAGAVVLRCGTAKIPAQRGWRSYGAVFLQL